MKDFTELEVWQKSRELTNQIYMHTKDFPKEEMFGLTNQMRRSAVSIPSNIAEGIGRQTDKDTLHFLHIARGSLFELETQIYIACDQSYLSNDMFQSLLISLSSCKKLLNGFIRYYQGKL